MSQFPWQRANVVRKLELVYNDEDLSGKMTAEDAKYLDDQNQRYLDDLVSPVDRLTHSDK
jgi:hypothetical protein